MLYEQTVERNTRVSGQEPLAWNIPDDEDALGFFTRVGFPRFVFFELKAHLLGVDALRVRALPHVHLVVPHGREVHAVHGVGEVNLSAFG